MTGGQTQTDQTALTKKAHVLLHRILKPIFKMHYLIDFGYSYASEMKNPYKTR